MYVAELRTHPGEKKRSGKQARECIKFVLAHSSDRQLVDHMPRSSLAGHRSVGVSGHVPMCDKAKRGAALDPKKKNCWDDDVDQFPPTAPKLRL